MLTQSELIRYSRQLLLPELGEEGQEKLKNAHVVIAGLGGLGCSSSTYLTSAGVGHITLIDLDIVELSDLNRQVLYEEQDIGERKVVVAQKRLSRLNPSVKITPIFTKITEENVFDLIKGAQVVVDGLDNFTTRYILNSACVKRGIPFIYGGVHSLNGMITTIIPGKTPCLACIYPKRLEKEGTIPILGSVPAIIANLQATEAIKLIAEIGVPLAGRLLFLNGGTGEFHFFNIVRNKNCSICRNMN